MEPVDYAQSGATSSSMVLKPLKQVAVSNSIPRLMARIHSAETGCVYIFQLPQAVCVLTFVCDSGGNARIGLVRAFLTRKRPSSLTPTGHSLSQLEGPTNQLSLIWAPLTINPLASRQVECTGYRVGLPYTWKTGYVSPPAFSAV